MTTPVAALAAALLLAGCGGSAERQRGQPAAEPAPTRDAATVLKDALIASDVEAALVTREPSGFSAVRVTVERGVATLRGFVRSPALKRRAVEVTEQTPLVKRVSDELRVRNAAGRMRVTGP